ncbi:MAG TPA: EAL domain-containing protein, partial [Candidatus Limnocylindria bacterium]|nr:EAL domain-containing protein [Candidatus Limnocylindria bacterium]
AGERRGADELADDGTWSSYAQFRRLFEAAGQVLGGQRRLADVGLGAWDFGPKSNPEWLEMLQALGSPGVVLANSDAYEGMWPLLRVEAEEIGPTEWVMRQSFKEGFEPFKEFCWFFSGLHAVTPKMFGFPTGDVVEEQCQCDGAPACLFRIRWEAIDEPLRQAEESKRRVQMLEGRLEALQRTVGDIVAGEELGVVLTRITASAARAVPAPAYVLALEALNSAAQRVYAVGLDEAHAARIADELLRDDGGPQANRLTVDIVSKRRSYGRLAAISLEDHQFLPQESVILEGYGRLAAAALDSATALGDARVLLELSTSLAEIVSTDELAAKIAKAAVAVVDCDRAVVVLVDPETSTARITATSGYPHELDAWLRTLRLATPPLVGATTSHTLGRYDLATEDGPVDMPASTGSVASTTVAIVLSGEAIGWVTAGVTSRPERLLVTDVEDTLRGLAGQAATAISNSRLLDQIRHQALHDALTGLPNRTLILDRVGQMLSRARRQRLPAAAMFIDLDGFKNVNDTLGHGAGDQLLQAVAARLATTLRDSDTIGRLGGDEFVVLVEGPSLNAGPELVAQRLLDVLREPFNLQGRTGPPLAVTASIGIAVGDRPTPDELLRDADVALYQAKAAGKDCFAVFAPEMQTAVHERLALETDMRGALAAEEFFLVYQPIFDLRTSLITGVEALLRWRHPVRGVVQPDGFIPVLEETGMIIDIGRWVLQDACRQAAVWHAQGHQLNVSINVSARQLEDDRFVDDVRDALVSNRLDPAHIIIEITETTIMRDAEATAARLKAIKALGVRIAIDDFGTGYSSLAYLRRFPVDTLKIDRSFITAIAESPEAGALIHTLVQLGKTLGLETLAEGIEEADQCSQLQREQCDSGQGFLFSRPLEIAALGEFLDAQAAAPDWPEPLASTSR